MFRQLLIFSAVLAVLGHTAADEPSKEETQQLRARLQAKTLRTALLAYFVNPNSGDKFPKSLDDLIMPPWGGVAYLPNGKADLLDPWGNRFKYEVATDKDGDPVPYVWTERIVSGKVLVLGDKPPEKKKD